MGPRSRALGGFRAAVAFLTRIPIGRPALGPANLGRSVPWLPVVGGLVGLAVAGLYAALLAILPALPAAAVAVPAGILLTGAIHEDGLADAADALGARSPEEARGILKDPAHGTYGVLALLGSVVARIAALAALGPWAAVAWLPAAHALGRAAAAGLLLARPTAGAGVGTAHASAATRPQIIAALGTGALTATATTAWWAAPAAVVSAGAALGVARLATRRFDGVSGDAMGAAEQVAEVLVLLLGAAVATGGWPAPAWWG